MKRMGTIGLLLLIAGVLGFGLGFPLAFAESKPSEAGLRKKATKLQTDGNYKEAFDIFSKLALSGDTDAAKVPSDFTHAVSCLGELNRRNEIDTFREKVIAAHLENWKLLWKAARGYYHGRHEGYIIAGKFRRGQHRGGGRYANATQRDRVRALQLMQQAMQVGPDGYQNDSSQQFYRDLADMIMGNRGYSNSWRLQYLTNLAELPDYETGYYRGYGGSAKGAPIDADGNPVYYYAPQSWEAAENDGQRWRWALEQIASHGDESGAKLRLANFVRNQFGVQTMADGPVRFGRWGDTDENEKNSDTGTWDLHTLGENETIAKLASGIKRFTLPDEFCYIRLYRELNRSERLVEIFNNRRQYDKSVDVLKPLISNKNNHWEKEQYKQITGNWGQFEPVMTQPAEAGATVQFRFRNATSVKFTAHKIDIEKLLADVKGYIKTRQAKPKYENIQIGNIGYQLVQKNRKRYIGGQVAAWTLELKPREGHFDKRITVNTPLQKAGAYLLTGQMPDGNTSYIVLWISDTAIVRKPLAEKNWYFVADAITGKPIAKANVEFFGYQRKWNRPKNKDENGSYSWEIKNFSELTDENGQVIVDAKQMPADHQWLVITRTDSGRLAYMGWNNTWYARRYDRSYNRTKTFIMTDRPVYRPGQKVNFKFWMAHAKYDIEGKSKFTGTSTGVKIFDPKGQKIYEKKFVMDNYGGAASDFELKEDATLGIYRIAIPHGSLSFRVEEYKKPEFDVKIEAPSEPVMLGEKITAKIIAKYYFGAPVTDAKVKYKIFRTSYSSDWYPLGRWDWLFGRGYGWLGYDYKWLSGWNSWGCKRPVAWWYRWRPTPRPEMIAENEVQIGSDGTVDIEIDTSLAKALLGNTDHRYEIKAEVTDSSRRTIVANGSILAARRAFKVYAWVNRGFYRVGDTVFANFQARTLDGKGVKGSGVLRLLKITYKNGKPVETSVQKWNLDTDTDGRTQLQITASQPGQYRLSYKVTDAKNHSIEGGYVFSVWGKGDTGENFRFNAIEIVPDRSEYKPGEKLRLRINTNQPDSTVMLFIRPTNGVYLPPRILHLNGKTTEEIIDVGKKDTPNFFIEALTVSGARVHTECRQIVVPPEKRLLSVTVTPDKKKYKPGEKGKITVELRDLHGKPFVGSVVLTMYDKAVEYISGGPNVPDIVSFFWKWKRSHSPVRQSSLTKGGHNIYKSGDQRMRDLGIFGASVADESGPGEQKNDALMRDGFGYGGARGRGIRKKSRAMPIMATMAVEKSLDYTTTDATAGGTDSKTTPTVRTKFADTALWVASLTTDADGTASVDLTMPENLTTWKTTAWAMGAGTRVGVGTAESVTTKNIIVRLQSPRFFVQSDEVVLSAVVHNYLDTDKSVRVELQISGGSAAEGCIMQGVDGLSISADSSVYLAAKTVEIPAGGEKRVDWRVKVLREGTAKITMSSVTDEESDAMSMEFPVYVHGMLKTESFCGVVRPNRRQGTITIDVPAARRPKESRLEVRYSPTLAGAMIDSLPYLVEYPYGCTEQTLNRFLPTVITQQVLLKMNVNLADIQKHITNLNSQEISNSTDAKRVADWKRLCGTKRWDGEKWVARNPVYSKEVVDDMVKVGLARLTNMQCSDGGWGWFSGWGEQSYPHTTAVVVHGLQIAKSNGVAIVPGVLNRGVGWLKQYQAEQLRRLKLWESGVHKYPAKRYADNLDALVYRVLVDAKIDDPEMRERIYRDRLQISVYAKCLLAIASHKVKDFTKRDMLIRNVSQFLVRDDENQTAYLRLPEGSYWWYWYGSDIETNAAYLQLLTLTDPKGDAPSRLVKYLLNNRRGGTYWNSTRDTAYCIEAFADFIRTSGEAKPDMTVEVLIDGKLRKQVKITAENLFSFDNKLLLVGNDVITGKHTITIRRVGSGSVYFNAYLTNFTLQNPISKAGLEIKVMRKYFKLVPVKKTIKAAGSHGQVLNQRVEKYKRVEIPGPFARDYKTPTMLKSGDLVEIELTIESKNDYEYIMFEDMKAAGFEPVSIRSGYGSNEMGAYMELRDNRVTFFVRRLVRGKHSITYRMRAEVPGKFSALPAKASAMYAPELKANSNEMKIAIED